MVLIPLGLVSKTKNLPIATVVLSLATAFFSIIHLKQVQQSRDVFWDGPARHEFAVQGQAYLFQMCQQREVGFSVETYCGEFNKLPLKVFLQPDKFDKLSLKFLDYSNLTYEIQTELNPEKLQTANSRLFQLYQEAEAELKTYVKNRDLLSKENITWSASLKSLFMHSGWLHLLGNLILLLFVAIPVEERLGPILFSMTYLFSGMLGSAGFAYFSPDSFYTIGASSAVSGVAGAMMVLFWKNNARLLFTVFLLYTKRIIVPVFIYAPLFVFASGFADILDPLSNTAHFAHFFGMMAGLLLGSLFALANPLPQDFTYPYEYKFHESSKENLSQYARMKVLAQWLYYTPMNMRLFSEFISEVQRSDMNPKVTKLLAKFRDQAFPDIYEFNRKRDRFIKILPVSWLHWAPPMDDASYFKKRVKFMEDKRDFQSAFKMSFLALNGAGWSDKQWGLRLYKNYKKASVDKNFKPQFEKLMESHPPINQVLSKKYDVDLEQSA